MAETKREIAFALFDEGKRPADPEVKSLGLKARTTYNYFQIWKGGRPEKESTTPEVEKGSNSGKASTATAPIMVGKITITPENWGMTQYGAILILDTFNKAKADLGYGGTIGEFLCDITEFYRRVLNYKEVEYVTGAGEGGSGAAEDGSEGVGQVRQLVK